MNPRALLIISFVLVAAIFLSLAVVVYQQYDRDLIQSEMANQRKITRIVSQSLNRYFETLRFIAENTAINSAFDPEKNRAEDKIRQDKISSRLAIRLLKENFITSFLTAPRGSASNKLNSMPRNVENWKLFKGLPEFDSSNHLLAKDRRTIARNILKTYRDLHYVFEMDTNGDLVFLEPFSIQKNVTSFNYEFRDYLRLAKASKTTAVSEGYISHDQNRTQIITIAAPIFDKFKNVSKIFAVSVSAATLRDRVFRALKEQIKTQDGTTFSFVDRHGHIVASSSGKNIYFPVEGRTNDKNDIGNIRSVGFFSNIHWVPDILEKGNIWERATQSWVVDSLNPDFSERYKNINGIDVFGTFSPISIIGAETLNWGILVETPLEQLLASGRYLKRVFIGAGLFLALILLTISIFTLKNFNKLENQIKDKEVALTRVASQVAHDIRSPLAALDMAGNNLRELPEGLRIIIRSAVARIRDISNNLLLDRSQKNISAQKVIEGSEAEKCSCQLLSPMIDSIVTEKRLQYRSNLGTQIEFKIDCAGQGAFASVPPIEFKRVISNLIDNGVEAFINQNGRVEVLLSKSSSNTCEIRITDNGKGIPYELLPKLGTRGVSHGKKDGTGLGLYHARTSVQAWNGSFRIESQEAKGTTVVIELPSAAAPSWFLSELQMDAETTIVIVDDDESIHKVWERRFSDIPNRSGKLIHLSSPGELRNWFRNSWLEFSDVLFLIDFEFLNETDNGLKIIEELGIQSTSILVTSRFEESSIIERCKETGVHLMSKNMAVFIPIQIEQTEANAPVSKAGVSNFS